MAITINLHQARTQISFPMILGRREDCVCTIALGRHVAFDVVHRFQGARQVMSNRDSRATAKRAKVGETKARGKMGQVNRRVHKRKRERGWGWERAC